MEDAQSNPVEQTEGASPPSPPTPGSPDWRPAAAFSEMNVYSWMGDAVRASLDQFLQPLQSPPDADYVVKLMMQDDFFPRFTAMANGFADNCCQKLVRIIHVSSRIDAVRQTPTPELAKRIRDASFKPLDAILAGYYGAAKKVEVITDNIRKIRNELAQPGRSRPSANAASSADGSGGSSEAWATEEELARQHERLIQAKSAAYLRMMEYLKHLLELPDPLLSYGCDKCFAGEVNFELELEQVGMVKTTVRNRQINAIETLKRVLVLTKTDLEEEKAFIAANIEQEHLHEALERMLEKKIEDRAKGEKRFKKTVAIVTIVVLLILLVIFWIIYKHV